MARIRFVLVIIVSVTAIVIARPAQVSAQPPAKKAIVERSPLLREPKTPEEMFAATLLMIDLARLDLAALYLEQFDDASPDDELLIKLRDKYGTGDFLKLAAARELQPRSTKLLEQLNAAARRQAEDPVFVDALIQRLTRGAAQRELAIAELRNAGPRVVPEILRQMSKPEMVDHQDTMVVALTRMGNQVIPPLIGALDSPDERIRSAVIDSLGWLEATEAIPYLWFPAFDEHQVAGVRSAAKRVLIKLLKGSPERGTQVSSITASTELRRLAKMLYRKADLLPLDDQGSVTLWAWDENAGTVAQRSLTPEIAAMFVSTRFARQALALSPEQAETQRQYLASLLGLEVLRHGWDKPRSTNPGTAMYLGLTAGEETMAQVLAEALEAGSPGTAVAALEVLGQIGTGEQLLSLNGLKSPVLAALNSPDRRVQFAAATTVLKLRPQTGFSGANRVVAILSRATTDPGQSQAIVIDADSRRASSTAGFLTDAGYKAVTAATGRGGFEVAATSAGVELIVIHVNCIRWELTQTLANLRADARTAAVPIVIYGPLGSKVELQRLVARSAPATYIAESSATNDFGDQLAPFVRNLKSPPLSPQERTQEKNAAVYWLATIGSGNLSQVFDISQAEKELARAVEDPAAAMNALIGLAGIGTGSSQRRLCDVALNPQANDAVREAAAGHLAYHIQRYGLVLTRDHVMELHSGWKRTDQPAVKAALAAVIGSLKPNATIVGERLQQFPTPPAN